MKNPVALKETAKEKLFAMGHLAAVEDVVDLGRRIAGEIRGRKVLDP